MYTLLSGLWRYVFQKDEYFVLILGLDNAGKTVSYVAFILWIDGEYFWVSNSNKILFFLYVLRVFNPLNLYSQ